MPDLPRSFVVAGLFTLLLITLWFGGSLISRAGETAATIIPADSDMARSNPAWQRLLLSPVEIDSRISKAAFNMTHLGIDQAPSEIEAKCGQIALALHGESGEGGGKGDFGFAPGVPGKCKFLGLWVYVKTSANVASVGIQVIDAEGECLKSDLKVDWEGWKWVEVNLDNPGSLTQAYPQNDKNNGCDFPLKDIHVVWNSPGPGISTLIVDGFVAVTDLSGESPGPALGIQADPITMNPGKPLNLDAVLTNFTDKPLHVEAKVCLQVDSDYSVPPDPDPILGSDRALGKYSWTESNGQLVEEGSLTDGKAWTDFKLPYAKNKYTECFQYIDLEDEKTIVAIQAGGGDANWIWKVDVAGSTDGKTYSPIPEWQGIDFHDKWGDHLSFPPCQPFKARYVRFRYHHDGQNVDCFSMPNTISIYTGIENEKFEIPTVGVTVEAQTLAQDIPARSFALLSLKSVKPLTPGCYALFLQPKSHVGTSLFSDHVYVLPDIDHPPAPDSYFGLNVAESNLAPLHRQLGVGWVRFENFKWPMFTTGRGRFAYDGSVLPWGLHFDQIVNDYTTEGISVLPFIFMTPLFDSTADASLKEDRQMQYPPQNNSDFAEAAFQTAARYGSQKHADAELRSNDHVSGLNQMHVYELWNEENLEDPGWGPWVGSMDQYYEMFRPAAEAVKAADPTARVTNGGFAGLDMGLLETLKTHKYADGKCPLDFVDILNVHYYSGRIPPEVATIDTNVDRNGSPREGELNYEQGLQAMSQWRDANKPGMPIWMSETGYDSAGPFGTSERLQAARLPRDLMLALAGHVDKVFVYRESGSSPSQHSASGLFRDDGSFKPSWFTYATLIRQIDRAQFIQRYSFPDTNVRLYAWGKNESIILTAWSVDGPARLNIDLGECTVTDAFGNVDQRKVGPDFILSDFPVYFSKTSSAIMEALAKRDGQAQAAKARELEAQIRLKTYLFDFGTKTSPGILKLGKDRPYTGVSATDVYSDSKGFGFLAQAAMSDDSAAWITDPLARTFCRVGSGNRFQFRAESGHYHVKMDVVALGTPVHIKISSGASCVETDATSEGALLEGDLEVTTAPVLIEVSDFAGLRWLSLVEKNGTP